MQHSTESAFSWRLGASRRYRIGFLLINIVVCGLLFSALPRYYDWLSLSIQLLIAAWVASRHHALFGRAIRLELAASELKLLKQSPDERWLAQPIRISDCRWLGRNVLVASIEPIVTSRWPWLMAMFNQRWLLLLPDNSQEADRHRLAMIYHSGAAE